MKKNGLNNPAVVTASTIAKTEAVKQTVSVIPFLIKLGIFGVAGWIIYRRLFPSFTKQRESNSHPVANITTAEATIRAEAIHQGMVGFGKNFNKVATALSNLNYNGFIRVYNAFGERKFYSFNNPLGKNADMIEWFVDEFNATELQLLRSITNNVF